MTETIEERLRAHGLTLPAAAAPAANYLPAMRTGALLFVSGQLPLRDGKLVATGKLGAEVTLEQGVEAARACALNILAQAKAALGGDLGRVSRVVKLTGFVAATAAFTEHHKVMNGASDLLAAVLGEAGRHARAAVGVPSLPLDAAVEVEAVLEVA